MINLTLSEVHMNWSNFGWVNNNEGEGEGEGEEGGGSDLEEMDTACWVVTDDEWMDGWQWNHHSEEVGPGPHIVQGSGRPMYKGMGGAPTRPKIFLRNP